VSLTQHLSKGWTQFDQDVIYQAVRQLFSVLLACIRLRGIYFDHKLSQVAQ